jgi:hypothetical protein
MQRYLSSHKNTGIIAYEIAPDAISIKFRDGSVYLYTNTKPGKTHVAKMKTLAKKGEGLTTYINQKVRDNYEQKVG